MTVKGKIFQLALNEEINISESTTKRSQMTGYLHIHMPKLIVRDGFLIQDKFYAISSGIFFFFAFYN